MGFAAADPDLNAVCQPHSLNADRPRWVRFRLCLGEATIFRWLFSAGEVACLSVAAAAVAATGASVATQAQRTIRVMVGARRYRIRGLATEWNERTAVLEWPRRIWL